MLSMYLLNLVFFCIYLFQILYKKYRTDKFVTLLICSLNPVRLRFYRGCPSCVYKLKEMNFCSYSFTNWL